MCHLEQIDLLKSGQVDVHGDGSTHHKGHLIQQLGLIWQRQEHLNGKGGNN